MSAKGNSKNKIKKEFSYPEESLCPSCGKFVGAYERCPYCQANIAMRISLKIVRRIAVIGSFLGVILLWFAAKNSEVPVFKIGQIRIENNMALVKIVGKVIKTKVDTEKNNFSMTIDDGTGKMNIGAYNQLKKFNKYFENEIPKVGDKVSATGNLSISETWGASMFLSSPARLKILEKIVVKPRTIEEITQDDIGNVYKMKLQITSTRKFKSGRGLKVKDNTGEMNMTLWDKTLSKFKDADIKDKIIKPGNVFEINVQIGQYKGNLQLTPAKPYSIKFIKYVEIPGWQPEKNYKKSYKPYKKYSSDNSSSVQWPEVISISKIERSLLYTNVAISGKIRAIQTFKTGILLEIEDKTGSIKTWISKNAVETAKKYTENQKIQILGKVDLFKNNIQLSVTNSLCLKKDNETISNGTIISIDKINSGMKGESVNICGTVEDSKTFKPGTSITINDGSAKISLWITSNVAKYLDIEKIKIVGTKLQIKGIVSIYKNNVQLTVKNSKNIKIQ